MACTSRLVCLVCLEYVGHEYYSLVCLEYVGHEYYSLVCASSSTLHSTQSHPTACLCLLIRWNVMRTQGRVTRTRSAVLGPMILIPTAVW